MLELPDMEMREWELERNAILTAELLLETEPRSTSTVVSDLAYVQGGGRGKCLYEPG